MNKKLKSQRPIQLEQWIEISVENGVTVSRFYPPNHELSDILAMMDPKPDLIYRRLNFVDGVPLDYYWVKPTPTFRKYGGMYVQRVLPEEWPHLLLAEGKVGVHVTPARYPQPRPESWGPCPCPACTKERETTPGQSRYDKHKEIKRDDAGKMIWH